MTQSENGEEMLAEKDGLFGGDADGIATKRKTDPFSCIFAFFVAKESFASCFSYAPAFLVAVSFPFEF